MKHINDMITEMKGKPINDQWINNDKPVMTADGRQVIITKVDRSKIPNVILGQVKMKDQLYEYEWEDNGLCIKAVDNLGNPVKPSDSDRLVKAI